MAKEEKAPDFREYPKWIAEFGITVESEDEEKAVRSGKAVIETIKSAQGDTRTIKGKK